MIVTILFSLIAIAGGVLLIKYGLAAVIAGLSALAICLGIKKG